METWIARRCRIADTRAVVITVIVAVAMLSMFGCGRRYWTNFVGGPYPLEVADLAEDPDRLPHVFVTLVSDRFEDSGIEEVKTSTHYGVETSKEHVPYWVTRAGDRALLVKSEDKPSGSVSGEIKKIPPDVRRLLSSEDMAVLHPDYLDAGSYRLIGWIGLVTAAGVLTWAGLTGYRASQRLTTPATSPVARRVTRWGDPAAISKRLQEEMAAPVAKKGGRVVTRNYVVDSRFMKFQVFRWEDLVWAYAKVVKKSVNFIPAGKDHLAILHFPGGNVEFLAPEKVVDVVLRHAQRAAPWAVHGYTDRLASMFRKDNAGFVTDVLARRDNPPAAAPPAG